MKLKIWEWALIASIVLTATVGTAAGADSKELSDKLIRLHVVANSDSDADQSLKLKVRDAVLEKLRPALEGAGDRQAARTVLENRLSEIEDTARAVITAGGRDYGVRATLCRESFPTTEYDDFALPAGEYLSLRVTIGEGAGHNWWCVVFPPICDSGVIDSSASAAIGLTEDQIKLVTGDSGGYVVRFRVMELWGKLMGLFGR